jgi:hypothetical protein
MVRRLLVLMFFLSGLAPAVWASDPISVKIRQFGLEGSYAERGAPTWIELELHNTTSQTIAFDLLAKEANLQNDARTMGETFTLPITLQPAEKRLVAVPLPVVPSNYAVIFVEARDAEGKAIGKAGRILGSKIEGRVIAMMCATPELCRSIRQTILLSGTSEEQTRKSQQLQLIQLLEPPAVGWGYAAADTVVVAVPAESLSGAQREALELYLHRGGRLVLVEDQLGDGHPRGTAASAGNDSDVFLGVYRRHVDEGKILSVGEGRFVHVKSAGSKDFADYFRPLGFSESTPSEIRSLVARFTRGGVAGESAGLNVWLMKRLGTRFHFPSFLELLLWIAGYLVLVGVVNFVILRRIGRPEWGWITIPAIAVLFSVLLYAVSARNHPSNFGIDEMTVYRMDNLSPLATAESRVRISAPVRSVVHPILPGTVIYSYPQRNSAGGFDGGPERAEEMINAIRLGDTWEASFTLRRWSFRDLDFQGQRRFAGTVYRDGAGRLHNETGVNYTQAIVADQEDVFLLGNFPAGAVVDLAHVTRRSYEEETGRRPFGSNEYPGPPFLIRNATSDRRSAKEEQDRIDEEFKTLSSQPFSLLELIRGWPPREDNVFFETKAVFFGLSNEATMGATLRDRSPDRKSDSLTVVTFGEWP